MGFQTEVRANQALGVAGEPSKAMHSYYNTFAGLATDANISFGSFVFQSTATDAKEWEVVSTAAAKTKPLGVVIRDKAFFGATEGQAIPKGSPITICNRGNVFVKTSKVAKRGQSVEIDATSGELSFAAEAGDNATGWFVAVGNDTATSGIIEITTAH